MSDSTPPPTVLRAPAKLNLGLRVGPPREDGFHPVETVFQTIGWFDTLRYRPRPGRPDQLRVEGPEASRLGDPSDNLLLRTLHAVRSRGGSVPPLELQLTKRLPIGAGLGGGSSDAAALLRGLERTTGTAGVDLEAVARTVGADVPFFLRGGTQWGGGIGDRLRPLPPLRAWALVGVPDYSVATEWAYRMLDERGRYGLTGEADGPRELHRGRSPTRWTAFDLHNDFAAIVAEQHSLQNRLLGAMRQVSAPAGLSGSGSAVFGLFREWEGAAEAKRSLRDRFDSVRWNVCRFLGSHAEP